MRIFSPVIKDTNTTTVAGCHNRRADRPTAKSSTGFLTNRMKMTLFAIAFSLALVSAGNADADIDHYRLYLAQRGDIPWQSLSPEEQEALQRYRHQWDNYSGQRQQEMRRGAKRYMDLPPQKRREVEQQRRHYQQLSPEERQRLREEYRRQKH
jgi:hypothetical protein